MHNASDSARTAQEKDDWLWLASNAGASWLDRVEFDGSDIISPRLIQSLRRELSQERVHLLIEQLHLRHRARRKFSAPEKWLWTAKLLEQASDEHVSQLMASYFPPACQVVDICCGAGSDAVALASAHRQVIAIDQDWLACMLTKHNLNSHEATASVREIRAEALGLDRSVWIHADPDRRHQDRRSTNSEHFSPELMTFENWIETTAGGSVKVAPATQCPFFSDRAIARQWIGWGGSVRQQRWWWSSPSFPEQSVTASLMDGQHRWHHFQIIDHAQVAETLPKLEPAVTVASWIGDCDPVIRAARLTWKLAERCNARPMGSAHGYLTSDEPISNPFVRWLRVCASMPMDRKKLRRHLHEHAIGKLEIKTRDVDLVPDELRKNLQLAGERSATLLITRIGQKVIAVLADQNS